MAMHGVTELTCDQASFFFRGGKKGSLIADFFAARPAFSKLKKDSKTVTNAMYIAESVCSKSDKH